MSLVPPRSPGKSAWRGRARPATPTRCAAVRRWAGSASLPSISRGPWPSAWPPLPAAGGRRHFFLFRLVAGEGEKDIVEARPVQLQVDDVDAGAVEVAHQRRQLARPVFGRRRDPPLGRIHGDVAGEVTAGDLGGLGGGGVLRGRGLPPVSPNPGFQLVPSA